LGRTVYPLGATSSTSTSLMLSAGSKADWVGDVLLVVVASRSRGSRNSSKIIVRGAEGAKVELSLGCIDWLI